MGLGHLCFVIGAQSLVARQSAPHEQDRNFGHFTIGASLGQLAGPVAAGALIGADMARTSAVALVAAGAGGAVALTSLWRVEQAGAVKPRTARGDQVPVRGILRARGVPGGHADQRGRAVGDRHPHGVPAGGRRAPGIDPAVVGLLLSLRAAATIACRLVLTPLLRLLGRTALLTVTCLLAALLCAAVALPLPVPVLALVLAALGFCLGVGQPLSMTTVVQAAPPRPAPPPSPSA